jgi:hypothetical protein
VGVADALCDLQYVLAGAVLEFGLKDVFEQMFNEVQRSNMSKSCETEEEAQASCAVRAKEFNTDVHYEKSGDRYVLFRSHDMKTLKSINYSPANLVQFFGIDRV